MRRARTRRIVDSMRAERNDGSRASLDGPTACFACAKPLSSPEPCTKCLAVAFCAPSCRARGGHDEAQCARYARYASNASSLARANRPSTDASSSGARPLDDDDVRDAVERLTRAYGDAGLPSVEDDEDEAMIDVFADVRYDDAFGPALSVVDAFRRVYEDYVVVRDEREPEKGAARVVALGATSEFELARWRTFAVLTLLDGCVDVVVDMVGPELPQKSETRSWTFASSSSSSSSSLTVCTHAGYFPDDFKPPPDCDMYVAFNAGLPIGDDWRAAVAAVVDAHLRASDAAAASASTKRARPDARSLRPPPFWASDYNEEAASIGFECLRAVVTERLAERSSLLRPVFLEPIYLNPFRSPRVFTQPTCAIPMTSNAFAFAFVGLTALA